MKVVIAFLVVVLALAGSVVGSYALSLSVAHQSNERLCSAFAYFIHRPAPPLNTAMKQAQEAQYQKLVVFERRLGC